MNTSTSSIISVTANDLAVPSAPRADDWQRRFGVPWARVDQAARAVLERAAAASKRRFADLNVTTAPVESRVA